MFHLDVPFRQVKDQGHAGSTSVPDQFSEINCFQLYCYSFLVLSLQTTILVCKIRVCTVHVKVSYLGMHASVTTDISVHIAKQVCIKIILKIIATPTENN